MSPVVEAATAFADRIAASSVALGRRVTIDAAAVVDRSDSLELQPPGLRSPNRSCRLVRAADGWIAVNLPRESDLELVSAWLGRELKDDPWTEIVRDAGHRCGRDWVEGARVLGLPVGRVGEVHAARPDAQLHSLATGGRRGGGIKVIDFTSMWAGPLCSGLLAAAGADVLKVESRTRPDVLRRASPALFDRLNAGKAHRSIDLADPADLAWLGEAMAEADVVVTSARPRAFDQLSLTPKAMFARRPGLTWVAISGYGWMGADADRVAFGDDAAAAGGLVHWTSEGEPHFLGDALADPLTGLAAAAGALDALQRGGGFLVDAALAVTAAGVASQWVEAS
jgi:hypothetical protein